LLIVAFAFVVVAAVAFYLNKEEFNDVLLDGQFCVHLFSLFLFLFCCYFHFLLFGSCMLVLCTLLLSH